MPFDANERWRRVTGEPGSSIAELRFVPVSGRVRTTQVEWAPVARHHYSTASPWNLAESLFLIQNRGPLLLDGQTYQPVIRRQLPDGLAQNPAGQFANPLCLWSNWAEDWLFVFPAKSSREQNRVVLLNATEPGSCPIPLKSPWNGYGDDEYRHVFGAKTSVALTNSSGTERQYVAALVENRRDKATYAVVMRLDSCEMALVTDPFPLNGAHCGLGDDCATLYNDSLRFAPDGSFAAVFYPRGADEETSEQGVWRILRANYETGRLENYSAPRVPVDAVGPLRDRAELIERGYLPSPLTHPVFARDRRGHTWFVGGSANWFGKTYAEIETSGGAIGAVLGLDLTATRYRSLTSPPEARMSHCTATSDLSPGKVWASYQSGDQPRAREIVALSLDDPSAAPVGLGTHQCQDQPLQAQPHVAASPSGRQLAVPGVVGEGVIATFVGSLT